MTHFADFEFRTGHKFASLSNDSFFSSLFLYCTNLFQHNTRLLNKQFFSGMDLVHKPFDFHRPLSFPTISVTLRVGFLSFSYLSFSIPLFCLCRIL
uniref:Uncharacterized protein n=1 Tax=Octopus bimaculoides TaxID=37653 RepID=A0A0L8G3C0_OCTBM